MGAEGSDPLSQCCCAKVQTYEVNDGRTIDHPYGNNERLYHNQDKIIKLQAILKGVVTRMKYLEKRNEHRKKSTHFFVDD